MKIMDIPNSKGRDSFWEAYRACVEENRVRPDRAQFYVNWAKEFANFQPEKLLKDRSRKDVEAFLVDSGPPVCTASMFFEYNIIKKG